MQEPLGLGFAAELTHRTPTTLRLRGNLFSLQSMSIYSKAQPKYVILVNFPKSVSPPQQNEKHNSLNH